jgi:3-hydroxyisobutyrate dehydrogenase-like beta-hydroxyacid dehydrogenase
MGLGLAEALSRSGRAVAAWNRSSRDFAGAREMSGVRLLSDLQDLARQADIVFFMVSDYRAAISLLPSMGDIAGRIIVGGMSGTPAQATDFAGLVRHGGARYLDAAIKKAPTDFAQEVGAIFYSGDEDAFREASPSLEALGGGCQFLGAKPGSAKAFELATLARNYMWVYGYFHALSLTRAYGIDVDIATTAMMSVSGNSLRYIEQCARQIGADQYPDAVMASTATHRSALQHVIEGAAQAGLSFPILEQIADFMGRTASAGWTNRDMPAFFPAFEAATRPFDVEQTHETVLTDRPAER